MSELCNIYGISGNNVTAGQKDYAARMMRYLDICISIL